MRFASRKNVAKPDLAKLQKLVGGFVELVRDHKLPTKRGIDVWVNEEGLLLNLTYNELGYKKLGCDVVGPIVIVDNRTNRSKPLFQE
jgi:hypothetical protein